MEADLTIRMQQHREYLDGCTIDESDYAIFESNSQWLQRVSEIENTTMAIYDTHRQEYLFLRWKFNSQICLKLKDNPQIRPDFLWQRMHPGDLAFVMESEIHAYQYIMSLPVDERKDYKQILDYRIKNDAGQYIWFTKQSVVLNLDKKGGIWLVLVFFDLYTGKPTDENPRRRMVNIKTGKLCLFNDDKIPSDRIFTHQEVEVLKLVAQGYSSLDITQKLYISLNTVNNHRKNILRKTKSRNITQAVVLARRIGAI